MDEIESYLKRVKDNHGILTMGGVVMSNSEVAMVEAFRLIIDQQKRIEQLEKLLGAK